MSVFSKNNQIHVSLETRLYPLSSAIRGILYPPCPKAMTALALLAGLSTGPAQGNIIQVNASCTLINAITAANTDQATNGCTVGKGTDTVVLPANSTHTLTTIDNGYNGLPVIITPIIIAGNGSTIKRVSEVLDFRIFEVAPSGDLTLNNTTVSGGSSANIDGAGINNYGKVTLNNSTVSGNTVIGEGAGGGINNNGVLRVINSRITDNYADSGGGINNNNTLIIINSTVSGNASYDGGAGVGNGGTAIIKASTVSGNSVGAGAAGASSLFDSRSFAQSHGAVLTPRHIGHNDGGGVLNLETLTMNDSTVSGNIARDGGGVSNWGTITLSHSTVSKNIADQGEGGGLNNNTGHMAISRSLVSGNTANLAGPEVHNIAALTANDHNLFGHDSDAGVEGFTLGETDIVPNKPLSAILNPLGVNGGPTQTHLLVKGSPAINANPSDAQCSLRDQRGLIRPRGVDCDIGAVEVTFCETVTPTTGCTVNGVAGQICRGTSGKDVIDGTSGNDVIIGLNGNDILRGFGGNDKLCGGLGDDRLRGGFGLDQLFGSFGSDMLFGGGGNDNLFGEQGSDTLDGELGADQLNGGPGIQDKCVTDARDTSVTNCEL